MTSRKEDVYALFSQFLTSFQPVVLEPWCGEGAYHAALRSLKLKCFTNDINLTLKADYHMDALQPDTYSKLLKHTAYNVIVTSPLFAVLDLALPLMAATTSVGTFCSVPGNWITNTTRFRAAWFRQLLREQRLHFVAAMQIPPNGFRNCWVCIFASAASKLQVLRPQVLQRSATMHYGTETDPGFEHLYGAATCKLSPYALALVTEFPQVLSTFLALAVAEDAT